MFIGEAPGYHEDQKGEPFVGAAGKLLTRLLAEIGMSRSDVYIANVLKCRPPRNRQPQPEEAEVCKPCLLRQIEIICPRVVCTLGNSATQTMLGRRVPISAVRGQEFDEGDFVVFPIFHPAAALHRGDMLKPLEEDFRKLKAFLDSEPVSRRAPEEVLQHEPEQLSLF